MPAPEVEIYIFLSHYFSMFQLNALETAWMQKHLVHH